jgi:hypothetical protein
LELHCRQKAQGVQTPHSPNHVVADEQQGSYSQLINKIDEQALGQHVGDLWMLGGRAKSISHGGLGGFRYAANRRWGEPILPKNVMKPHQKLVDAHIFPVREVAEFIF